MLGRTSRMLALSALMAAAAPVAVRAALLPGDIAIIGRTNSSSPDTFAFLALRPISTGEVIYFTDNGWTGTQFRGASASAGAGLEQLLKWTSNATIPAGSVILSSDTSANFTWTSSGTIPGASGGNFSQLDLHTVIGDQIYAFQASASNPLLNPTTHLYAFDDTNGFEAATSSTTGDIPSTLISGTTGTTINSLAATVAVNTGAIPAGGKLKWLNSISNSANWSSSSLPSSASALSVTPIDWKITSGNWNTTQTNFAIPPSLVTTTSYMDGDTVEFPDIASNSAVTIPTTVKPAAVIIKNTANRYTFNGAGVIGGDASLTKQNSGIAELQGNQSYTGATSVTGGMLLVTGALTSGGGDVTVTGGALGGTGSVNRNVSINSGGSIAPGNGSFSISNFNINTASTTTTFAGGGQYIWEVKSLPSSGTAGSAWDLLTLNTLSITADSGNKFVLKILSLNGAGNALSTLTGMSPGGQYTWTIANTGGITGFDPSKFSFDTSSFLSDQSGFFALQQSGNNLNLIFTIPEPGSLGVMWICGMLFCARLRRTRP